MKSVQTLTAAFFAMGIGLSATAQDAPTADTVLATVDGTQITLGHVLLARTGLPDQYQQLPPDVLFTGLLDQLIQQQVLADSNPAPSKRVKLALANEERALTAGDVIEAAARGAVTEDALQAAYDAAYSSTEGEPEFNANHILVETEEEAQAILAALSGGEDFEELAKQKSTGPSGPSGGALGWFSKGMMVPEFETAVMALETGAVSDPVQTQFGWHVVKLNESRTKAAPTLEQVRAELESEIQAAAIEAHIAALTENADVDRSGADGIDPSVISNMDLLEQ